MHRHRFRALAAGLLAGLALAAVPGFAHAAGSITVLDDTFYSNVSLGAERVNVLVLDFEKFYLRGSAATEQRHLAAMRQVIAMTQQIRPGERYGMYGISDHYDSQYLADVKSLESGSYAYFPTNYTSDTDTAAGWTATTTSKVASARAVGSKPVYLYVWPEYRQGGFLPAWDSETTGSQVSFNRELSVAENLGIAGVVVWSQAKAATSTEWVNVVHDYQNGTL